MDGFGGLSDADFDAYLPAKWRSNVYNRERLDTKQRLLSLGTQLGPLAGEPLDVSASVEHPALVNGKQVDAQHLFFSRGKAARRTLDTIIDRARGVASLIDDPTPQRSHVFLSVSLHHDRIEVALRLSPEATVDRQNLVRKCQDPYELDRLGSLVRALPPGFAMGIGTTLTPTDALSHDALAELLRRFAAPPAPSLHAAPQLTVMRGRPRAEVLADGAKLAARLTADLSALLPLYRFCAWARDNDSVSVKETLEKTQLERRQKGIARGDEVRIVRGLFAGQNGTVQDVDPRGAVRLLVGKRTLKVDAADVERRA